MRLTIQYKLTIIIALLFGILFSGIYVYLKRSWVNSTNQRIESTLRRDVYFSRGILQRMYKSGTSLSEIDQVADFIGENLDIRVTIIASDGKVLGDSQLDGEQLLNVENHIYRPEIQQALKQGEGVSRRFSTTVKNQLLYMAVPFQFTDMQGFIRLAMPLSEVKMVERNIQNILIGVICVAFVLAILGGYAASIFLSRPIAEVSQITRNIANGDFSKKVSIHTDDEFKDLAQSINYMSDQIKGRMQEVTTSKSRLETVFLSMVEGVLVVDDRGMIILMNQALKDFLHVRQEALGKRPIEIIRNVEIQDLTDQALSLTNGVLSKELTVLLPEEKTLLIHAAPVIRYNKSDGAVLVFHDITDLRRLEKVRQDFVANVSHELRTPIATIKGYAETLLQGAIDDKENAEDFLRIICSDANRLAKLINDLLDLSKIESGKLIPDLRMASLEPLISRVVDNLAPQAKELSVSIENHLPKSLPPVKIDSSLMTQVFFNLLENAIKYNRPGGKVYIESEESASRVVILVRDTGIGIPKADLGRIFERFYRVDKARSRDLGGTGLGLSIIKHIVQVHEGTLSVESELGHGSIFSITLPKI